jgi:rRNA-processing protein FCF1
MPLPLILALISGLGVFAAWAVQSPELLLVAGPSLLLSLWAWLKTLMARWLPPRNLIVVDGSNVLFWRDNTAQLSTLIEVLRKLEARGFLPGVVFDANAGYLIDGQFKDEADFAALLDLPPNRVRVVDKSTPADPVVLDTARKYGVQVVSNDRFRDWADRFPEVNTPRHILRGGYDEDGLWLD